MGYGLHQRGGPQLARIPDNWLARAPGDIDRIEACFSGAAFAPHRHDTYAVGVTASMGTVLLASGTKGKRYALPHATIHMHPASSGAQGYTEDVRIAFREQERVQTQLFHLVGKHSGHDWKEIEEMFIRDRYMNALEAKTFGLVDQVLGNSDDVVVISKEGQIKFASEAVPNGSN